MRVLKKVKRIPEREDITVVYYTANKEEEYFEKKITETLLENIEGLPLISVSQKPMQGFGTNICVGTDIGWSGHNEWRQLQIGTEAAKSKYIALAESDFLYPKEHYRIKMKTEDEFLVPYRLFALCSMRGRVNKYRHLHVRYREATSIVGREYLLNALDNILKGRPMWKDGPEHPPYLLPYLMENRNIRKYRNPVPVVTFRTDNNMHIEHVHDNHPDALEEILYWGKASEMMKRYHGWT